MNKLKIHLLTLPRWFALPFFAASTFMGIILAGGDLSTCYPYLGLLAGLFLMAGGHSFNTLLDYSWTGLDKGEVEQRSAEKSYTGGQSVIARGLITPGEVFANACGWYVLALIPIIFIAQNVGPIIYLIAFMGMGVTFWYSWAKFNYTHELALGVGVGPIAVLLGMFSVSGSPDWLTGLIISAPFAVILSFAGLALDEWPDAEANLKKGVRSIAYKVWEYKVDLGSYLNAWIGAMYTYQVFLITVDILCPLTGITFILLPLFLGLSVMLKGNFEKAAPVYVVIGALYPILLVLGQALGG